MVIRDQMLLLQQMGLADLATFKESIKLVLLKAKPSDDSIDIDELRYNLSDQLLRLLQNQIKNLISDGQSVPTLEEV